MYFQFLVEDISSKELIDAVMAKLSAKYGDLYYRCSSYSGFGGFNKDGNFKDVKNKKLLNELPSLLRAFNKSLQKMDNGAAVVIVVDNDDRNTEAFKAQLESIAAQNMITIDYVFCIAVEEMEAWLLGDEAAILRAYPQAKLQKLHAYRQDSICGTWEVLADVVYPGGYVQMKKACSTYMEIGRWKSKWASEIGTYLNLSSNRSPSFCSFLNALESRLSCA